METIQVNRKWKSERIPVSQLPWRVKDALDTHLHHLEHGKRYLEPLGFFQSGQTVIFRGQPETVFKSLESAVEVHLVGLSHFQLFLAGAQVAGTRDAYRLPQVLQKAGV